MAVGINDLLLRSFQHWGCLNLSLEELLSPFTVDCSGWELLSMKDLNFVNILLSPTEWSTHPTNFPYFHRDKLLIGSYPGEILILSFLWKKMWVFSRIHPLCYIAKQHKELSVNSGRRKMYNFCQDGEDQLTGELLRLFFVVVQHKTVFACLMSRFLRSRRLDTAENASNSIEWVHKSVLVCL